MLMRASTRLAGGVEAGGEEEVDALVADAVASEEGAERAEPARAVARLLEELAAGAGLGGLAVQAAGRTLEDALLHRVAVDALEEHAPVLEERHHHRVARVLDEGVGDRLSAREGHLVLAQVEPAALEEVAPGLAPPAAVVLHGSRPSARPAPGGAPAGEASAGPLPPGLPRPPRPRARGRGCGASPARPRWCGAPRRRGPRTSGRAARRRAPRPGRSARAPRG